MSLLDRFELAIEDILRFSHGAQTLLDKLDDADPAQPGAASYGPVRNGTPSELWCDEHERAQHDCERAGELCTGVPVVLNDRTGEAALGYSDDAAVRDKRQIERDMSTVVAIAARFARIDNTWKARSPTRKEQRETESANVPGCELHASVGVHVDAEARAGLISTAGGWPLPRPMRLCSSCRQRIGRTHRVPSKADLEYHIAHLQWPRMLDVNYRAS